MMTIACLAPIYPCSSVTFIRREVATLEKPAFTVQRFTLRRLADRTVDEADRTEEQRTRAIWNARALGLAKALVLEALTLGRPVMSIFVTGILELIESGVNRRLVQEAARGCLDRDRYA